MAINLTDLDVCEGEADERPRCATVMAMPVGRVYCLDRAGFRCAGCGGAFCAACLVPAGLCLACEDARGEPEVEHP